jgi:hypothetical protein
MPDGDSPGEWIEVNGPIAVCENGVHACAARQLAPWIGNELWAVELAGEILETQLVLVASRARLLAPVRAWDEDTRTRYGEACQSRASPLVAQRPDLQPLLARIQRATSFASAGAAGYWAAMLAGDSVADRRSGPEYERGFAAERAAQADWLQAELSLDG